KGGGERGADYTLRTGTLTFGPGIKTQTISILLKPDTIVEGNETFTVGLSASSGPTIPLAGATATVTITDNDVPGTIQFSAANYTVTEAPGGVGSPAVKA